MQDFKRWNQECRKFYNNFKPKFCIEYNVSLTNFVDYPTEKKKKRVTGASRYAKIELEYIVVTDKSNAIVNTRNLRAVRAQAEKYS